MTRKCFSPEKSTAFSNWLREQAVIDSSLGFVSSNVDYVWCNYKTGTWMYLEEKRYMSELTYCQERLFKKLDRLASVDPDYYGFYLIQFQMDSPLPFIDIKGVKYPIENKIVLTRLFTKKTRVITIDELLSFLKFDLRL